VSFTLALACKIMRFSSFILKNLTRRPFRTGLTLLALSTAIASLIGLLGIAKGFVHAFEEVYTSHSVDIVVSRQGSADRLSSSVDEGFVARVAEHPSVNRTAGVLLDTLSLEDEELYGLPTMGIEPGSWLLEDYQMVSQMDALPEDNRWVMLGVHLADRVDAKVGETVNIFDDPYRVIGVYESQSTWENGSMILPLAQLQSMTDRDGQVTYVNVVLETGVDGQQAESVVESIESIDARLLAMTTEEFVSSDTRMQVASAMAWMTSIVALMIGAVGTLNTMMTSVLERTGEIGVLRAVGWPRRRVAAMILMESVGMSSFASLIGAVLAIAGTWILSQADQAKGILSPSIDLGILVQGFVLAIGIGLLGAILPAWRATRLQPTEAFADR
jgi:putative ABC transport system permease protein